MIIADTSGLLALFNRREPEHAQVREVVAGIDAPLVISPFVVAEIDYLVATRVGADAEAKILQELGGGAYVLAHMEGSDLARAADVIEKYKDQGIGVADASIVVLAQRYGSRTVLTLDHCHFDVLRPHDGGRFTLLP